MLQFGGLHHCNLKLACEHERGERRGGGEVLVLAHLERGLLAPRLEAAPEHLVHLGGMLLGGEDQFR